MKPAAWVVLITYASSLFLVNLGPARTFTAHEGFVAQIAREMLATGEWLVPQVGGQPWLEKPPLPHWSVAALGWLCGDVNEVTARLPSVLAGLVGVLLVASLATRWFGPTHGFLAGLVQATMLYAVSYSRLAEADIYLWTLILGWWWIFTGAFVAPTAPQRWYSGRLMFFLLLGLTQLTKGPLFGAVIALLPCVAYLVVQRQWSAWRWFCYWPGLLLGAVVAVAWPVAILLRYPETANLWWLHTFGRIGGGGVINPEPVWYYFTTIPWQVLPWTLVLLIALPASWRRAWRGQLGPDRFLWLWLLMPVLLLSALSAKHHHYLIYALPPCSIWAAEGLLRLRPFAQRLLASRGVWLVLAGVGAGSLAVGLVLLQKRWPQYTMDGLILGTGFLLGALLIGWYCATHRPRRAAVVLFATIWVVYGYLHAVVLPKTDQYDQETALFRRIDQRVEVGTPVLVFGLEPSRVLLYLQAPIEVYVNHKELRARGLTIPAAYVLTSRLHEGMLWQEGTPIPIDEVAHPPRGPGSELVLYRVQWRPERK